MSDNINFLCEKLPSRGGNHSNKIVNLSSDENDFEDEIRRELDIVTDLWKSSLAEKLAKKLKDFELIYKNKNTSLTTKEDNNNLQSENKELKARLYDCLTIVASQERELTAAKLALDEILLAYTDLSERHAEKTDELEAMRDELEKTGTFVLKSECGDDEDDDDKMKWEEVRERTHKAIEQIERSISAATLVITKVQSAAVSATAASMSPPATATTPSSLLLEAHLNRMKAVPLLPSSNVVVANGGNGLHSTTTFRSSNLNPIFISSALRDSNSARSSISHLSVNGNLENDNFMLVDSSTSLVTKKEKPNELGLPINELAKLSKVPLLSADTLDRLFIESKNSPTVFAGKLLRKYFSTQELTRNCNVRGNRCTRSKDPGVPRERLDPVRVELIQRHIYERIGAPNDDIWQRCIAKMNFIMNRLRKIKEDKFFERPKVTTSTAAALTANCSS